MTFVDELKTISDTVELQHKLDRQFAELKSKMKTAASNGYRTFQIEVFYLHKNCSITHTVAENCYVLFTHKAAAKEFYERKVIDFLCELGFNTLEIDCADHKVASCYESRHFSVRW